MPVTTDHAPRGSTWVRSAIALAASGGSGDAAADFAARRWGAGARAVMAAKAATASGDLAGSGAYDAASAEMIALVKEQSIIGRARFRRAELRVRSLAITDNASAAWVAPGEGRPLSGLGFDPAETPPRQVAAMTLATKEALTEGGSAFEDALREEMARALAFAIDAALLDPENDGSDPLRPPSPLFGAPHVEANGAPDDGMRQLVAAFEGDLTRAVFVLHPAAAAALAGADHPGIGLSGGELLGASAYTTRACPPGLIALIDPARVLYGTTSLEVQTAAQGTVEVASPPVGDAASATATEALSLFQTGTTAIRAELGIGWRIEAKAAAYMTGAMTSPVGGGA